MTRWSGQPRPREWHRTRARILKRDDHQCQMRLAGCTGVATAVDHIIPVMRGGTDDDTNLRAVCYPCHQRKSNTESQQARGVGALRKRPPERHPGLIDPDDAA